MFTIKLMKMEDEKTSQCVVSCARYGVNYEEGVIFIIAYPESSGGCGIEYRVDKDSHYSVAFIENSAGKTIDKLGPVA